MARHSWRRRLILALAAACVVAAPSCSLSHPPQDPTHPVVSRAAPAAIPASVLRLAILYPRVTDPALAATYAHLEARTFFLKTARPSLQFVERRELGTLLDEHRLQLSGAGADETTVRLGALLGADSLLQYRVERPSLHDRMWALFSGRLPPVRVFTKITRVESGEVVFHHEAVVQPPAVSDDATLASLEPIIREAVDAGIDATLLALRKALGCPPLPQAGHKRTIFPPAPAC